MFYSTCTYFWLGINEDNFVQMPRTVESTVLSSPFLLLNQNDRRLKDFEGRTISLIHVIEINYYLCGRRQP